MRIILQCYIHTQYNHVLSLYALLLACFCYCLQIIAIWARGAKMVPENPPTQHQNNTLRDRCLVASAAKYSGAVLYQLSWLTHAKYTYALLHQICQ